MPCVMGSPEHCVRMLAASVGPELPSRAAAELSFQQSSSIAQCTCHGHDPLDLNAFGQSGLPTEDKESQEQHLQGSKPGLGCLGLNALLALLGFGLGSAGLSAAERD